MKQTFSLLFLLFGLTSFAQTSDQEKIFESATMFLSKGEMGLEIKNYDTYVFADTLLVRSAASLKAATQDTLLVGDNIKIIEAGQPFKIGNRTYPWFKISYTTSAGKIKVGYAWGGLLSWKALRTGNTKFVYSVTKIQLKGKPSEFVSETHTIDIKAVENRKAIAKASMIVEEGQDMLYANALIFSNRGLSNAKNVILIGYSGGACGVPTYYFYQVWNGKNFVQAPRAESIADAGAFYENYTLVFPNEKGGLKDKIIQKYEYEETIDEAKNKYNRKKSQKIYSWTGSGFLK